MLHRRLRIRTRLTLSYAGLVTGCGAVLIAIVYFVMRFVPSYRAVAALAGPRPPIADAHPTEALMITSADDFLRLYLIASGQFNATTCAAHIGRQDDTVLGWVHRYNAGGPDALTYRRTGGHAPLFNRRRSSGSPRSSRRPGRPSTAGPATAGP